MVVFKNADYLLTFSVYIKRHEKTTDEKEDQQGIKIKELYYNLEINFRKKKKCWFINDKKI